MIKFLFRHNKDYSRFNIIKKLTKDLDISKDIYILLPFSKNQFFKNFFKRKKILNDFFISNYDTYVYDRKKITKKNPRAWWKYFQDWVNFRFSKYLLSDTMQHFKYWEELFGKFNGKHFVLPVLADKSIYFPNKDKIKNEKVKILFYGSFIPLHGIDVILDALYILEKGNVLFDATLIGNGQMYKKMKSKYDTLNLKNVKMDGFFISEDKLSNEIRKSDIILGIFGNSKKAQSVVPNKVYQALACKKLVITMSSDAINEFFTENEIITCKADKDLLAKKLKFFILDKEKREEIANNGYKSFCRLYDKTKNDFINFINEVDL